MDRRQRPGRNVLFKVQGSAYAGPTLSKSHQDKMTWDSDDGDFTIDFPEESPFDRNPISVTAGKPETVSLKEGVKEGPYKYNVLRGGVVVIDPTVFIDP